MPLKRIHQHADYSKLRRIKFLSRLSTVALIALLVGLVTVIAVVIFFFTQIPSPESLANRDYAASTKIYDRNGELLYDIFQDQNRTPVKLADIPDSIKHATISIEDKDFYKHQGFSVTGILRSFFLLITHRQVEGGGSTLTQQLVKNTLVGNEQTLVRKIKELILAIEVEHTFTKDQILEMYLNEIPYGGTAYGVEAAANLYFGKHAKDLTLAESSLLAGLPQRPSVYSPYGSHPELAKVRQKEVLKRMVEDGYITLQQANDAEKVQLTYRTSQNELGFKAPHFVLYVKDLLEQEFGAKVVTQGGLRVYTTLDYKIQQQAEKIVKDEISGLKNYNVGNGAAVIMNPKNGQILAMVGSKDYFGKSEPDGCSEEKNNCVFEPNLNLATSERQPGSATKPITYSVGLEKKYTAATPILDVQTDFPGGNGTNYTPVNYDGKFHGPVQMRYALGNSFNIPAVKMMAWVGVKDVMDLGHRMGLTTWDPTPENVSRVGLSLTLGGREVQLLDLTNAYATLANTGKEHDPISIIKVTDSKGKTLVENKDTDGVRVLDEGISYIISNILADNGARSQEFGSNSVLQIPGKTVSVKTGTTDEKRDNWTVGYTPSVVVGVWVGNNDNEKMNPVISSGITGASPIWQKLMKMVIDSKPDEKFVQPGDVVQADVDGLMGGAPHDGSPTRKEYFIKGTEPTAPSSAYQNLKVCKNNPHRQSGDGEDGDNKDVILLTENDPIGDGKWQAAIDNWVLTSADARFVGAGKGCNGIPGFAGGGNQGGVISIVNIANGANVPRVFDVLAKTNSPNGVKKVTWTVDGAQKSTQTAEPFALHVEFPQGDTSSHTITATLEDNAGGSFSTTVGVTVSL